MGGCIRAGAGRGAEFERAADVAARLADNVQTVIHGKTHEIRPVLAALACGGHVLFEDVPGTAKTVLARAIAQSIEGAVASRIQCTQTCSPLTRPGWRSTTRARVSSSFAPGRFFANVVLVDEINRAMPKTQSALLEAMAETQVTIGGATRTLPKPFLLLATENLIEYEGTFPLPEAQLDRFFLKTALGYPDRLRAADRPRAAHGHPLGHLQPAVATEELIELHDAVEEVYIDRLLVDWLLELVRATRSLDGVALGASVRIARARTRRASVGAALRPVVRRPRGHRGALPPGRRTPRLAPAPSWSCAARGQGLRWSIYRTAAFAAAPRPEPSPVRPV